RARERAVPAPPSFRAGGRMGRYILRRLAYGAITIWLVTVIVFVLLRVVVPLVVGDVVDIMVGEFGRNDEALAAKLRSEYGLDRNVATQYVSWVGEMLRGEFGVSLYNGRSVLDEMAYRLPVSFELSIIGLASAVVLAIPMGLISAV